jgi:hypothetical protein
MTAYPRPLQHPFVYNQEKSFKISSYEFRRYILPRLKTIAKDYFTLYEHFHEDASIIKQLKIRNQQLQAYIFLINDNCATIQQLDCQETIKGIYRLYIEQDELIGKLLAVKDLKIGAKKKNLSYADNDLQAFKNLLDKARKVVQDGLAQASDSFIQQAIAPIDSTTFQSSFREIDYILDNLFLNLTPVEFRDVIELTHQRFFRLIEMHIIANQREEVFLKNIESMNFHLNLLNSTFLNNRNKLGQDAIQDLTMLHAQWNMILRYLLTRNN